MIELSQRFVFGCSHSLDRPGQPDAAGSRRPHGHTYEVRVVLEGEPDPRTGMLVDIGELKRAFAPVQSLLQHDLLERVPGLGCGTIENMARWIWDRMRPEWPDLVRVEVGRDAHGDLAAYRG